MLGTYEVHYAEVLIRLRADTGASFSASRSPSQQPMVSSSLCGSPIAIKGEHDKAYTVATIGGVLLVNNDRYALTAAHSLPHARPAKRYLNELNTAVSMASDDSSSHRSQEHSQLPNRPGVVPIPSTSLEAYAIRCEAVSIDPESRRLMRDPVVEADHRINGSLRHAIINQEEDWALIPLDNPRYSSNNVLSVDHDTEKIVQGISENMPLGTIFLGSGVSGPSHTVFYRTHSLFLLPSSRCLQVLWGAAATTCK